MTTYGSRRWFCRDRKDSTASVREANQYIVQGDLRAAEIQLRNTISETPQDPVLHARLAEVYFQLGDAQSAECEARAARERNGNEADYLPVLVEAMFGEGKFADLVTWCNQATRMRRSRARSGRRLVSRRQARAETLLGEAIKLDSSAARPKIQLSRVLSGTKPAEADALIDEAIAANRCLAEALQVKGEMLRIRGDLEGAMRAFRRGAQDRSQGRFGSSGPSRRQYYFGKIQVGCRRY